MAMRVLVAVASRHGSTREIALAIAGELRAAGVEPEMREVETIGSLDGYDAAIVGSAVYVGQWMAEAKQFVARYAEQLATIPVWLFSSGPIGDEPWPPGDPSGVAETARSIGAREHVVFTGKLDSHTLGFAERLVARAVHAPTGDFRDWEAISAWAREIGATLVGWGETKAAG
jgi:menaquinone-dependent protoporphyrinogen oxidase